MGIIVGLPKAGGSEKELQLNFGVNLTEQVELRQTFLPAEWYPQSGVQLTWPHRHTDWKDMLEEVQECFLDIAQEISQREKLLIVTPEPQIVRKQICSRVNMDNVRFLSCQTNDTWARDHGAITLVDAVSPLLLDFCFNGWGMKFPANYDNQITWKAYQADCFHGKYFNLLDFVLEGGSIESDGLGTLLTTSKCLLSPNRNDKLDRSEIEIYLKKRFHLERVLWLDYGYLAGDDTDSHIDTLARFCPEDTIVYVKCTDISDEHYEELEKMEEQLGSFRTLKGQPYRLLPLPLPDKIIVNGERLPATYANFLVINQAVLYPVYNQSEKDEMAGNILSQAFPNRQIIGIDCCTLIKQHGSLHCVTMQFPQGVLK